MYSTTTCEPKDMFISQIVLQSKHKTFGLGDRCQMTKWSSPTAGQSPKIDLMQTIKEMNTHHEKEHVKTSNAAKFKSCRPTTRKMLDISKTRK